MNKDARFYFANLGADVARCIRAADEGNEKRYEESLDRARMTLSHLRSARRPEAYEEGLLLLRAFEYARQEDGLRAFEGHLMNLISGYAPWPLATAQ